MDLILSIVMLLLSWTMASFTWWYVKNTTTVLDEKSQIDSGFGWSDVILSIPVRVILFVLRNKFNEGI